VLPIKVLQITHDLNIGGLQRVVVDLAIHLDQEIFHVGVLCLREKGPLTRELEEKNIPVFSISHRKVKTDFLTFAKAYSIIRQFKPDVVHTHNTQPFIDGTMAAFLARVPVKVHTDHARNFPDKKRYMFAEWIFSHMSDRLIAVSEHTKNNLIKFEKIGASKIDVIHNGIDGNKFKLTFDVNEKKKQFGVLDRYPIVGLGVRITKQKGITHLIRAVSMLIDTLPDTCLLIAGDGPLQNSLKQEAVELGVAEHIRFVGPQNNMNDILQIIDIFALPSLWEGLPLVILEAMAAKKPIIATNVGGNTEVIKDNLNGILVDPERPDLLADAIISLAGNKTLMEQIANNAYSSYEKNYSVSAMAGKYMKLYAQLLKR